MKFVLLIIAFFLVRVALAEATQTYNCTSSEKTYGVLKVTDAGSANATIAFTPDLKSATTHTSEVSALGKCYIPFLSDFAVIQDPRLKFPANQIDNVLISPRILAGEKEGKVILVHKEVTPFLHRMKSMDLTTYDCVAK